MAKNGRLRRKIAQKQKTAAEKQLQAERLIQNAEKRLPKDKADLYTKLKAQGGADK
ncbi:MULTISPECIES: hypothetical protein [unclassified Rhizobium]|uniref:hypothetical protein n=1 Tax=unclassified Rhizobium TaxID=2613769 RepID=UPI001616D0AB|nr:MULTISPECIES: hypothetical protein [unclassified Rhizobium]MBB3289896.1 hypothetical protein [Rhizobium sp. BK252]MBB3404125.1 hypothetical protein [Rhizobium sp. BK289]MBB3417224.1 hypothetical protein [Rhizobium sp. BK284]MBB3485101.1 hypothetical protein [Rhizobium sp. BK347]